MILYSNNGVDSGYWILQLFRLADTIHVVIESYDILSLPD